MKKIILYFLIVICLTVPIQADEPIDDITSSLEDEMTDFEDSLPDYIKEILPPELFDGDYSSLIKGEINHTTFLKSIVDFILADLPNVLQSMSVIMIIVIISSIFNTMTSSFNSETLKNSYSLCSSLCISITIFSMVSSLLNAAISYMKTLCTVMNAFAPVLTVMHIMSGNISSAALGNASMLMFISLIENVLIKILMPIVSVCLCFSLIKAISGNIDVGGISKFIRNSFVTITVFTMMIFSFVFSFQNVLTQSADSLSMKTAKFAIGSFIPIVGSSIGDALRTVTSSIVLVKNSCGIIAVICVVLLTLPIVVSFYLHKLSLDICSSLSNIIGCNKESSVIADASGICSFMLALVACTAVFFIFALTIFIKTTVGT